MSISIATHKTENKLANEEIRQANKPLWLQLLQFLACLAIATILLEGYFRLAGVGGQEFLQPDLNMGCRHIPGKKVIWRLEGYSNDKLSSIGLRDSEHNIAKVQGTYRIALLGDSAVESLQVLLNDTFGKVLEKLLNAQSHAKIKHFEVINFGCSSYSTGQELMQYEEEVDKYKPDAVVLLYNRGDSLENIINSKDRKRAEPRPYFYLDEKGQLQKDDSILLANKSKLEPNSFKKFLRENSAIYGVLNQADFSLTLNEPRYRKIKSWWQSLLNFPNKLFAKEKNLTNSAPYPDQNDMAVTEALLNKLGQKIKNQKGTFILTVFPNTVNYKALTEQANTLKELAKRNGFTYLDLSKSFLATNDPTSNFIQYHFSKKGHAIVAYDLGQIIGQLCH